MEPIHRIAELLVQRRAHLSTAESCTGGMIGHLITNVPGSSEWYVGGVITYSNALKHGILGVRRDTLDRVGAVSSEVAEQMATGARQAFDTEYAISVTGVAGPGGGSEEKPVGLTYVGVATPEQVVVRRYLWQGTRDGNKGSSAHAALALLLELLEAERREEEAMTPSDTVEAHFGADGTIRPLAFVWKGRRQRVTDWGRSWQHDGTHHFLAMTVDQRVWELQWTPATGRWRVALQGGPRLATV